MPPKEKKPRLRESVKTKTPEAAACKKHALNFDSDGSDAEGPNAGGGGVELKINEEFAKRFEHNKKREELQRC